MASLYDKPVQMQFQNTYVSPNFDMLMKAGNAMQGRSDAAHQAELMYQDTLLDVDAMDPDVAQRDILTAKYEGMLEQGLEQVGGDYTRMVPVMQGLQKDLHRELSRGELGKIHENRTKYDAWVAKEQERADKGIIDYEDFEGRKQQVRAGYLGAGTMGDLQNIELKDIAMKQDLFGDARKIASQMTANSNAGFSEWFSAQGGNVQQFLSERGKYTVEQLTAAEIEEAVANSLSSDPKYSDYLNQKGDLSLFQIEQGIEDKLQTYDVISNMLETPIDNAAMAAEGLDPNNQEHRLKYAEQLMREQLKEDYIENAASAAGLVYQYSKRDEARQTVQTPAAMLKAGMDNLASSALLYQTQGVPTPTSEEEYSDMTTNLSDLELSIAEAKAALNAVENHADFDPDSSEYKEAKSKVESAEISYYNKKLIMDDLNNQVYDKAGVTKQQLELVDEYENTSLEDMRTYLQDNNLWEEGLHDWEGKLWRTPIQAKMAVKRNYLEAKLGVENLNEVSGVQSNYVDPIRHVSLIKNNIDGTREDMIDDGTLNVTYSPIVLGAAETDNKDLRTTTGQHNKNLTNIVHKVGYAGLSTFTGGQLEEVIKQYQNEGMYVNLKDIEVSMTNEVDPDGNPLLAVTLKGYSREKGANKSAEVLGTQYVSKGGLGAGEFREVATEYLRSSDPNDVATGQGMLGKLSWANAIRSTGLHNLESDGEPIKLNKKYGNNDVYLKKISGLNPENSEYQAVMMIDGAERPITPITGGEEQLYRALYKADMQLARRQNTQ